MAPIAAGELIPDGTLAYLDDQDKFQQVSVHSLAKGKKVILFAVPGAFTPGCRYSYFYCLKVELRSSLGFDNWSRIMMWTVCEWIAYDELV